MLRSKKELESIVVGYDAQLRALSDAEVLLELAEEASDEASAREAEAAGVWTAMEPYVMALTSDA